jgi:capsular exopolysaccharide synthesis family protein
MLQRLQAPLNSTPEHGVSDRRPSEVAHLLPDSSKETEGYGSELMEVDRFVISSSSELRLVAINEPAGVGAERLRTLASRLKHAQQQYAIKKLLVTSAVPGEGKTLISANLAITLAMHRQKTLIIDGDLRGGSLGGLFDVEDHHGLADWWETRGSIMTSLCRAAQVPLWVLPAGKYHDGPLGILQSPDFVELMAQLYAMFDWIIIDTPPLTPFADAATLANLADAVLLVTRQGITPKKLLREALKSIDGTRIIATVLNEAQVSDQQYYHRYYQQSSRHLASGSHTSGSQLLTIKNK